MNKILENLKAFNANSANREIIAAHKEKVEAARAAGPSKEQKKFEAHLQQIFNWLKAYDQTCQFVPVSFYEHDITIEDRDGKPKVYGGYGWASAEIKMPYYVSLHFDEVWAEGFSRWSSRATGKYKLKVGGWGKEGRLFRELKNGTFKYQEIASEIFSRLNDQRRKAVAEAKAKANRSAVADVKVGIDHEFQDYRGITLVSTTDDLKPVMVKVEATKAMTVDAAIELLNVLKKHGIG